MSVVLKPFHVKDPQNDMYLATDPNPARAADTNDLRPGRDLGHDLEVVGPGSGGRSSRYILVRSWPV